MGMVMHNRGVLVVLRLGIATGVIPNGAVPACLVQALKRCLETRCKVDNIGLGFIIFKI